MMLLLVACTGEPDKVGPVDTDLPVDTDVETDESAEPQESDAPYGCEVGTGELEFVPFADGDPVTVFYGGQGGWHIWGSVRCWGLEEPGSTWNDYGNPLNPDVTFEVTDAERGYFGGYTHLPRGMDNGDPPQLTGEQLVLWTATCAENIGKTVHLHFHVKDLHGVEFDVQRTLVLAQEEAWEGDTVR